MLIASACLGDSLATVVRVHSLLAEEDSTYTFTLTDIPTGERVELSFSGENDAICAFGAWILADESEGEFKAHVEGLYARVKSDKFLP